MSNGRLGTAITTTDQVTIVYVVPASALFATVSIDAVNDGIDYSDVKVYFSLSDTPSQGDLIDTVKLAAGGHLIQNCRVLSPGERVIVVANSDNIVVRVEGLEEPDPAYGAV